MAAMAADMAGHAINPARRPHLACVDVQKPGLLLARRGVTIQAGDLDLPVERRELPNTPSQVEWACSEGDHSRSCSG